MSSYKYKESVLNAAIQECRNVLSWPDSKERLKRLICDMENVILCCGTYNYHSERFNLLKELRDEAVERYLEHTWI